MGQLFPFLPAKEASGDNVVDLFLSLNDSVISIVAFIELPMKITVEDLQPFY